MKRDVFKAIADPTRRKIIDLLFQQTMTLNAIADQFHISRPAISKHIKILTDCGLIIIKQEGRERYCTAQSEPLREVSRWTKQYKSFRAKKSDVPDTNLTKKKMDKKSKKK